MGVIGFYIGFFREISIEDKVLMKTIVKFVLGKLGYEICKLPELSNDPFKIQRMLIKNIRQPVIFDVGAHHGKIANRYKELFPDSTIYCFEPYPESFEILSRKFSSDNNVFLVNKAVSDKKGKTKFYVNSMDATNSLLPRPKSSRRYYPKTITHENTIDVDIITIDEIAESNNIDGIDILKLDIQGGEKKALEGAVKLLSSNKISIIFTEIMFVPHYENGVMFNELHNFMIDNNYSLYGFYDLKTARNGQIRYGDGIFISDEFREKVIDVWEDEY